MNSYALSINDFASSLKFAAIREIRVLFFAIGVNPWLN
jgi:hypothetical protein